VAITTGINLKDIKFVVFVNAIRKIQSQRASEYIKQLKTNRRPHGKHTTVCTITFAKLQIKSVTYTDAEVTNKIVVSFNLHNSVEGYVSFKNLSEATMNSLNKLKTVWLTYSE
jgi:lipoprotein NlpI